MRRAVITFPLDAIDILRVDCRHLENLFEAFFDADSNLDRRNIIINVCRTFRTHLVLEETVFYPAVLCGGEIPAEFVTAMDFGGTRALIDAIEHADPEDADFDDKVQTLAAHLIRHSVEPNTPQGQFLAACSSSWDGAAVGRSLLARKEQLAQNNPRERPSPR